MIQADSTQYQLPKTWVWTTLGEIRLDKSRTIVPTESPNEIFELYSVPSFASGKPEIVAGKEIGSNKQTVEEDAVLLCKINPRINRVWIVGSYSAPPQITSTEWLPFFKLDSLEPKYLQYFMENNTFRDFLTLHVSGVGGSLMRINANTFIKYPFPLSPLPEQHRIVTKIEELFTRLDAGIEALNKVKLQLKRYRQSVLKSAFEGKLTADWREAHKSELEPVSVLLEKIKAERAKSSKYRELPPLDTSDLPEPPKGWVWARVGDVSEKIHYGYTASANSTHVGPKMLRITDIQNDSVNWATVPYCRIDPDDKPNYLLEEGDLVFARTGATVGKSYLIRGQIPEAVFASYLIRIILPKHVMKGYVSNFFQSYSYWLQIRQGQLGIGQPNVNSQTLSRITLPLAPLKEQVKILEEIERYLSVADEMEKALGKSLKQSDRLRQSILKKAFEGKLVLQDPNDEPADKLLERIKAEKTRQEASDMVTRGRNKRNTGQRRLV